MSKQTKRSMLPWALLGAPIAAALLVLACYNPEFSGTGGFACNKNGTCPEGFVCAGAAGNKRCVKEGQPAPDVGAPDQGVDTTPDPDGGKADQSADLPPASPITCSIESGAATGIADSNILGRIGLAFDESNNTIYMAYVISTGTSAADPRNAIAVKGVLGPTMQLQQVGKWALTGKGNHAVVSAMGGKWAVAYQDIDGTQQQLKVVSSATPAAPELVAKGYQVGRLPAIQLLPNDKLAVAHQFKEKLTSKSTGQVIVLGPGLVFEKSHDVSSTTGGGLDNQLSLNESVNPPLLLYGSIAIRSSTEFLGHVATAPLNTLTFVGKDFPAGNVKTELGIDLDGLNMVMARKTSGPDATIGYWGAKATTVETIPGLSKVAQPRIAHRDGLSAVVTIDASLTTKLRFTVRDDTSNTWTSPLELPKGGYVQVIATPGPSSDTVFHVLWRGSDNPKKITHQPIRCTRTK